MSHSEFKYDECDKLTLLKAHLIAHRFAYYVERHEAPADGIVRERDGEALIGYSRDCQGNVRVWSVSTDLTLQRLLAPNNDRERPSHRPTDD